MKPPSETPTEPREPHDPRPWAWARARDVVWTLLGVVALLFVVGSVLRLVVGVLLLLASAAILAFILRPAVTSLERALGLTRPVAALVVYLAVAGLLVSAGGLVVTHLTAQLTAAASALPSYYEAVKSRIPDLEARAAALGIAVDVRALRTEVLGSIQSELVGSQGIAWVTSLSGGALNVVVALFLSYYLVVDGDRLGDAALAVAPASWKPYVLFSQKTLLRVVGGYLRGQLMLATVIGSAVFLGCLALGIRYSVLLGVLAFFLEMIPLIGPFLTGAAMVSVALFTSLQLAAAALAYYLLVQLLESYILAPRITGRAVGIHPLASMLGLIAGAKLFGFWGTLFAVPVMGFVFVIVAAGYRQVRGLDPSDVVAPRPPVRLWRSGADRRDAA